MTRINAGIPPRELTQRHLLAEHREIKRIPNTLAKRVQGTHISNIPQGFRLGTGHVKFFYDKIKYLHNRYQAIYEECRARGYNVRDYNSAFEACRHIHPHLYNDWEPQQGDAAIIKQRIAERLAGIKNPQ